MLCKGVGLFKMHFWTDKSGKKISFKEFLQRSKQGLRGITPLQQTNIQIKGTVIIIIGLLMGIFVSIIGIKRLWWLLIILIGGMFNTLIQLLGLWQKKQILLKFEVPMITNEKEVKENV
jgi:hypothetical protein